MGDPFDPFNPDDLFLPPVAPPTHEATPLFSPVRSIESAQPPIEITHLTEGASTADKSRWWVWLIPVVVLVGLGAWYLQPEPVPTPTSTTSTTTSTSTTTTTTSTSTSTTTTSTSTTTTTTTLPLPFIEPAPAALPQESLTLSALGIGPLEFGDPAADVLGVLAATFGQPVTDTGPLTSQGEYGTCAGDTIRLVGWDDLQVLTRLEDDTETFAGFAATGPTLATLSGLRVGDTLADLRSTYGVILGIDVRDDPDLGPLFELSNQTGLLLWGLASDTTDDATITLISSPPTCTNP